MDKLPYSSHVQQKYVLHRPDGHEYPDTRYVIYNHKQTDHAVSWRFGLSATRFFPPSGVTR
uniref:Uncharacterized protein n=1 Tax=Arundo donax TaxID=35708 RepID=A0A0A9B2P7_ARUDO